MEFFLLNQDNGNEIIKAPCGLVIAICVEILCNFAIIVYLFLYSLWWYLARKCYWSICEIVACGLSIVARFRAGSLGEPMEISPYVGMKSQRNCWKTVGSYYIRTSNRDTMVRNRAKIPHDLIRI